MPPIGPVDDERLTGEPAPGPDVGESMTQVRFGAAAARSRFSRSPARFPSLAGMVVRILSHVAPPTGRACASHGPRCPVRSPSPSSCQCGHLAAPLEPLRRQSATTLGVGGLGDLADQVDALRVGDHAFGDPPVAPGPFPVGPRGDLVALLTQDMTDRLDREASRCAARRLGRASRPCIWSRSA